MKLVFFFGGERNNMPGNGQENNGVRPPIYISLVASVF